MRSGYTWFAVGTFAIASVTMAFAFSSRKRKKRDAASELFPKEAEVGVRGNSSVIGHYAESAGVKRAGSPDFSSAWKVQSM